MQRTVSHILDIRMVTKEYLLGLSLNSIMSLMILIMAEKDMMEQKRITAAKTIVVVPLF
jgi:hypothetical protein